MKSGPDWDDYAYFAAVARHGSLAQAANALDVSQATLSRRMRRLETLLGRRLFLHGADGYALSADGRVLLEKTQTMEDGARDIARWHNKGQGPVCVRISAGTWTSQHLAENLPLYWTLAAPWVPEFVYCDDFMDIARRQIDIGIRNRRPEQPWLAGRMLGHVDHAVYGQSDAIQGWIGPAYGAPDVASSRWIAQHHQDNVVTKANTPQLACALAKAGIGRVVLPTFMGDHMAGLEQLSDPIAELRSEEWLVSHQDARHDPPIRAALDAIAKFRTDARGGR